MMKLFLLIANGFKPFTQGRRERGAEGRQPPHHFPQQVFFPVQLENMKFFKT